MEVKDNSFIFSGNGWRVKLLDGGGEADHLL